MLRKCDIDLPRPSSTKITGVSIEEHEYQVKNDESLDYDMPFILQIEKSNIFMIALIVIASIMFHYTRFFFIVFHTRRKKTHS